MEDNFSTVSVVIPTNNRAKYLLRALKSVEKQTHPPNEVIIVDDGSTDNTASMVRNHYSQFHYVYQEQKGVSAARNRGIRSAKSQWIAFLDSDDEWLPNKLAAQLQVLEKQQHYFICHTDEIWIRNGNRVNPMRKHAKYGGHIFNKCLPLCLISPSSVLIHKELFKTIGFFDESLPVCEDYDLWLRICAKYPVFFISFPLIIKYGGHDDQLSRRYWGMDRFRIQALENVIKDGQLALNDFEAAIQTLNQKIDVYINGAKKRGRFQEVLQYELKKREVKSLRKKCEITTGEKRNNPIFHLSI